MHWKKSFLAKQSRQRKGKTLAKPVEQLNRAAARATYRMHSSMLSNPGARRRFASNPPELDDLQQKVLDGLHKDGVSLIPFSEFLDADPASWEQLRAEGRDFAARCEEELAARRAKQAAKAKKGKKKEKGPGKGDYILRLHGKENPKLPSDDTWLKLGLEERMLDVINSYFGLWSRLTYVDLWYTPPAQPGIERVSSQRWHRDYNDKQLVKVFIYLEDVDEDTGPLEYVPGSAFGGEYAKEWPWRPVSNDLYPPQEEFEERIPAEACKALTGPAGTIAFVNTSGFHRGGYVTGDRARVMAVYNYVSPASLSSLTLRNFDFDESIRENGLSEAAGYALGDHEETPEGVDAGAHA